MQIYIFDFHYSLFENYWKPVSVTVVGEELPFLKADPPSYKIRNALRNLKTGIRQSHYGG